MLKEYHSILREAILDKEKIKTDLFKSFLKL